MRILTIKFPTSNKTYEYLERNPDKVRINYCEKLKLPQSFTEKDTIYKLLTVVDVKDVDVIPSHVTSFIEPVDKDNIIRTGKVSEIHLNQLSLIENKSKNTYEEPILLPIKDDIKQVNKIFSTPIFHNDIDDIDKMVAIRIDQHSIYLKEKIKKLMLLKGYIYGK